MKKLTILSAIALSGLFINTANAQIRVSLGFGFTPQTVVYERPVPVVEQPVYRDQGYQDPVYDNGGDDYYYLPDVDAYYSVDQQCYYYNDGDNWISAAYLPGDFRDYNWRYAPHYEVRAMRPYLHNNFYREHYNGHFINDWNHNVYREESYGGYRGGRFHGDSRQFNNMNYGGYDHGNYSFNGRDARPDFHNYQNRPMGDDRRGNQGYYRQPDLNNGRNFNGERGQYRNNFDSGNQHYSYNAPQGSFGHRGMNRF